MRVFLLWAAALGFSAVALGAFGAHGLRGRLDARDLDIFETGVRYQAWHVLAVLGVALLLGQGSADARPAVARAGWAFVAGTLVFSGSLYALVLTQQRWMGAVTPLGGLMLLAGWTLLAWAAWRTD
ncbi:MAG: DUF423 domain-containing protein [Myxococcota bacterium]